MNNRRPFVLRAFRLALLFALCALPFAAHAQPSTATLSGTVVDQNGGAVPGTAITILNAGTSLSRQATTNDEGNFTVPLLSPGAYTVSARRDGFAPLEIPNVVLNVGDQKALKIELKTGDVNATVQVVNEAPLINESPSVGTIIDRQFVGNLPLNGRSFQSLILLTPGILPVPDVNANSPRGQFSVNGQRTNANYFTVDGVSANVGVSLDSTGSGFSIAGAGTLPGLSAQGTTNNLVSVDALEEFRIETSSYSAELGRLPGAQVQMVTRSGTNRLHGALFDYLRNDVFDARNYFNQTPAAKPPLRMNDFGGTLGGPVILPKVYNGHDRTFFFFSYEGQRLMLPVSANFFVPSLSIRQNATSAMQPILNSFPTPTGPETEINGTPSGAAPWIGSYSSPKRLDATSLRLDHSVNSKLSLFGRINYAPSTDTTRTLMLLTGGKYLTKTLTLGSTLVLTPQLNNELRFNYSSNRGQLNFSMDNFGGGVPVSQSTLLSGYNGPGTKWAQMLLSYPGLTGIVISLGDLVTNTTRQLNIADNVSWGTGTHQFKVGVDYRRMAPILGPVNYNPLLLFLSKAGVLSGTPLLARVSAKQGARPIFRNYAFYAEDRWRPSKRATVSLGLRWDINPAPHESSGLVPALVAGAENISTATLAPPKSPLYKTSYRALGPRLGVAYQLSQVSGRETVIRGGFGVYYDQSNSQGAIGFGGYPFVVSRTYFGEPFPLPASISTPPAFPTLTLPTTETLSAFNPKLREPYTLEWNVALAQSLGSEQTITLSYVASAARNLLTTRLLNATPPSVIGTQPNPNLGQVNYVTNGPTSDYTSFQLQFQRRLSRGVQALANYTWGRSLDQISDETGTGTLERGSADFDIRHSFSSAITYDFPKVRGLGRIFRGIVDGWSTAYSIYAYSGSPFNPSAGLFYREDGVGVSVRPDVVPGQRFWISDPSAPGGRRLNPAAFSLQPADPRFPGSTTVIRQGTLGRNVVRLPGWYTLNMSLSRHFNFSENWNLQISIDAFNLFNHPVFAGYGNSLRDPSNFGVPTATLTTASGLGGLNSLYQLGGNRSLQFSAKLRF